MKMLKKLFYVGALLVTISLTTGCGGNSNQPAGAVGGVGYPSGIQMLPNGGIAIPFTATGFYSTSTHILAGQMATGQCGFGCFSAMSTVGMMMNWAFPTGYQTGTVSIGGAAYTPGMPGAYTANSPYEPGASISIINTNGYGGGYGYNSTVTGAITLSPTQVQRFGVSNAIGAAFEIYSNNPPGAAGAVLLYTSQDGAGYHGLFFAL